MKTRLARGIGPQPAASLYTSMLADTVTKVQELAAELGILIHEGRPATAPASWPRWPQSEGELGDRLRAATLRAQTEARFPLLFLGSDSPDLPGGYVRAAMDSLADSDVALGPTADGGVWCIGLRSAQPELFAQIPWSSPQTGAALRNRSEELGLKLAQLPAWQDVDELSDLIALAERLERSPGAAPHTHHWLSAHAGPWHNRPAGAHRGGHA